MSGVIAITTKTLLWGTEERWLNAEWLRGAHLVIKWNAIKIWKNHFFVKLLMPIPNILTKF